MDWGDSDGGYYEDDEDMAYDNDDEVEDDAVFGAASSSGKSVVVGSTSGSSSSSNSEKNYTILNESEIRRRQNEDVSHISSVLSLSTAEASLLLCKYDWNVERLHEEWFADETAVREKVGLINNNNNTHNNNNNNMCGICFDECEEGEMRTLGCDHTYCVTCWGGYISSAINERGSGALSLKCPGDKCGLAVTRDVIDEVASEEERQKYGRYLVRSYVESRKERTKWCPAPGCDHAVEFERDGVGNNGYDVTCVCSNSFCWNCAEEPHRPVDCKLVEKWILKNSSEAENTKWILAFSKPCPKCKRPIEKNMGCSHMTCGPPCLYEFCWICLENYRTHRGCNAYTEKFVDVDKRMRENARLSLQRYAHYYERWASNNKSREKAIEDLHRVETDELAMLSDRVRATTVQLSFIVEGWNQIIECRRVLKWTYAYGYYLEEREPVKKQFFEYLQGLAENYLEKLHECAERELSPFLKKDDMSVDENTNLAKSLESEFNKYRTKLEGLTKVTGKHFEELVRALETGLTDVVAPSAAPSSSKSEQGKKRKVAKKSASSQPPVVAENFDMDYGDFWYCDRCTFRNPDDAPNCQMCYDDQ